MQCCYNTKKFFVNGCINHLCAIKLFAIVRNWTFVLHDTCTKLVIRRVSIDVIWLIVIRICTHDCVVDYF